MNGCDGKNITLQKKAKDDGVPCLIDSDRAPAAHRKSWARLIKKIYEVDPLLCLRCKGPMRIISFIEDLEVIRTILQHLKLLDSRSRPLPKAHAPPRFVFTTPKITPTWPSSVDQGTSHHAPRVSFLREPAANFIPPQQVVPFFS